MSVRVRPPRRYAGDTSPLARMRRDLAADLSGADPGVVDAVTLCGSGLFTNAVRYTASGRGSGEVIRTLWAIGDRVCVGFTDDGDTGGRVPAIPHARTAQEWATAEGGRGLFLIEATATVRGHRPVCECCDLGRHTWAAFTLPRTA
ncbi:ATP-binding protein [Nocardiopsis sp. N85]|uniref:ATP-binding protein n=1 Tax=Nocardiopsis sp. N85 TaxID=3029400 RepID=UPI00237F3C34|nr:ATP-binding protein [Nocardiopsis sp. N85]MDE3721683.1 ATP-binding protein [Nocardiopsis sp. N85]